MISPDIRAPEAVDPAWLTAALQAAGVDAVVAGVETRPVGSGQVGDTVRFSLTYQRGGEHAPSSLIGKFPAADPTSFRTALHMGNYAREVMFYRHLAERARLSLPRCYMAELDAESGRFALLLEDLAPAEQGDQLKGVSLDQARLVIDEAAKLHASHWSDDSLDDLPWIWLSRVTPIRPPAHETVQAGWRGFRERHAERLTPRVIEVVEGFTQRIAAYRQLQPRARCLAHYDYRPDNMMFATPAGGRPVTVLDWQSVAYASGAGDLAYFLAGSVSSEMRRAHERELLARYLDGLKAQGVEDYGAEALQQDYAVGGFRLLLTAFMAAMTVQQTPRGDEMFLQMISSAADHVIDNEGLKWLA